MIVSWIDSSNKNKKIKNLFKKSSQSKLKNSNKLKRFMKKDSRKTSNTMKNYSLKKQSKMREWCSSSQKERHFKRKWRSLSRIMKKGSSKAKLCGSINSKSYDKSGNKKRSSRLWKIL
jgi:hypothetical protein